MAGKDEGIHARLPWWNGDWSTFTDYTFRVELRADSTKKDELCLLGPKLAYNLTGKAFDSLTEINREELKKENGWRYLITFLEKRRGKDKVDVLGDLFQEFFLQKSSHRREGEDLADYEARFRQLVRRLEKAMQETNPDGKLPPELFGWFLLNVYMKLDPSDTANVRGKAESYKVDDVLNALKKMWSGGGLSLRDMERKKRANGGALLVQEPEPNEEESIIPEDAPSDQPELPPSELEETAVWYQEALEALLEEPEDGVILANYRDARRALDQARTSRGFFPVRNPNSGKGFGRGGGYGKGFNKGTSRGNSQASGSNPYADKICVRCGKKGHIARLCPQRPNPQGGSQASSSDKIGYVGFSTEEMMIGACEDDAAGTIFGQFDNFLEGKAILDSGASDNIVGVDVLQDLTDHMETLG